MTDRSLVDPTFFTVVYADSAGHRGRTGFVSCAFADRRPIIFQMLRMRGVRPLYIIRVRSRSTTSRRPGGTRSPGRSGTD